jgi:hypothetical protein
VYNIRKEFGIAIKLVWLIIMCLIETYSKVCISKFPYLKWSETRRCFITTALQLSFRIWLDEGPGNPGGTEIGGVTSAFGLC